MSASPSAVARAVWLSCLTAAVLAVYGYAASGPLRAADVSAGAFDMPAYLGVAEWILDGFPADMHEVPPLIRQLPIGYPLILVAMRTGGLATERGLITLNLISLVVGLWASSALLRRAFEIAPLAAFGILMLTAASAICCNLTVAFAAEMPFFAASTLTVLCLERSVERRQAWPYLLMGVIGCAASISIRAAGVALVPPLLWATARQPAFKRIFTRKALLLASAPAVAALWLAVSYLAQSEYVARIVGNRYSPHSAAWDVLFAEQMSKIGVLGELFTNLRAEEFRQVYRGEFVILGMICLSLIAAGFWSCRRRLATPHLYVAAYGAMLAVYPFFYHAASRRFWFPVLPFLFALAFLGSRQLYTRSPHFLPFAKRTAAVYVTLFVLWGCAQFFRSSHVERETDTRASAALSAFAKPR